MYRITFDLSIVVAVFVLSFITGMIMGTVLISKFRKKESFK